MAEAPVPMTATRSPVRSWSWSHWALWKIVPGKSSMPGTAGSFGSARPPKPAMSTRAVSSPVVVSIAQ